MKQKLIELLKESNVVEKGKFTFYSGIESNYKIVLDEAMLNQDVLDILTELLLPYIGDCEVIIGQITNGDIIAQELARKTDLEFRKYDKKANQIYGEPITSKYCLLIDDVRSTGKSLVEMAICTRNNGGIVTKVYTVVDWGLGNPEKLMEEHNLDYIGSIKAEELLE